MSIAIKTIGLTKYYKDKLAVDSLSLDISEGEVFALLGPNGSGKTTTIRMLSCLIASTSGDAIIMGFNTKSHEKEIKKLIAVSPQETAVARNLTALENIEMIAEISGKTKKDAYKLAESFGLLKDPKLKAKNLSGGNQRRLSIAMALIEEPKILFLDEPTLGLDIEARYDLWDAIKKIKGKTTIILTTHYLEEADALADRIAIIKEGKIIELGTSDYLKQKFKKSKEENPTLGEVYIRIVRGEK